MTGLGMIGGDGARLHDAAPRRRSPLGHLLVQPVLQLRFTQFLAPRQVAQLFHRPLRNTELAQHRHRLAIKAKDPLPPIAQHIDHRHRSFRAVVK
jgi:hypothetical protein